MSNPLAELFAFLDTSYLMQYQSFHEPNWQKELGAKLVCLVLCAPVLDELDRHKVDPYSSRLRERSSKVLRALNTTYHAAYDPAGARIRDGVRLKVDSGIPPEPLFQAHQLATYDMDSRIIASALFFKQENGDPPVTIITGDNGMYARARQRRLDAFLAPKHLRLDPEPDPATSELTKVKTEKAELEKKLLELEQAQPVLDALLTCGNIAGRSLPLKYTPVRLPAEAELQALVEAERKKRHYSLPEPPSHEGKYAALAAMNVGGPSAQNVRRYREELEEYLSEYSDYLRTLIECQDERSRSLTLGLKVINTGPVAAKDVTVELTFPAGIVLREDDYLPEAPDRPVPPAQPRSLLDRTNYYLGSFSIPTVDPGDRREPKAYQGLILSLAEPLTARYRLPMVLHNVPEEIPRGLAVTIPRDCQRIAIVCRIHSSDLRQPAKSELELLIAHEPEIEPIWDTRDDD